MNPLRKLVPLIAISSVVITAKAETTLAMETIPAARFEFSGPVGQRVVANKENWLLTAPAANPGMLEMFRVRDRRPVPKLVPWAGEFVGKYLISTIQSLRLSNDPRLQDQVKSIVAEFIATQADDGYLGPFPKSERLLKHWDLWGHYHALLALTLWYEYSGDPVALSSARKAADLVCTTYLDTNRRVLDAGDHEMNMAILTGMAMLHRITGEERYLRMAREVEKDWEKAGDYVRTALAGHEFYQSPRPRWESLHDLQGLVELWRITGEERYHTAFIHHWRSIRRWDRRNTGGFSSGEQATGNPFSPTAIETCCTVAWMALTIDYLRLTGEAGAADELELSTLNAGIGSQHSSGRWWTYSTPMDGTREASAHAIVFQSRAGTPELNCCSVNGPRVLGMLSEWAIMSDGKGLVINWLGAGRFSAPLADGTSVTLISSNDAWRDGSTVWRIEAPPKKIFPLRIRVPGWTVAPKVKVNGEELPGVAPGGFFELERSWNSTDRIEFSSRMTVRSVPGARETESKVSLYYGPLLLAFDQAHNAMDDDNIPPVDLARLAESRTSPAVDPAISRDPSMPPWLIVAIPTADGRPLRLVDYASAGASGTHYRSWLPAQASPPPPALTRIPHDGARLRPGPLVFQWFGSHAKDVRYRVEFSNDPSFSRPIVTAETSGKQLEMDSRNLSPADVSPGDRIYWRVATKGSTTETMANVPAAWFQLDPAAPPQKLPAKVAVGPAGEIIVHSLRESESAKYGRIQAAKFSRRTREGTELNGLDEKVVYETPWPEGDFTLSVTALIKELPKNRIGQIFSAWAASMDDPLRIVVDDGKVYARVEAGNVYSTPGAPLKTGHAYAITVTRRDATLTLYLDNTPIGSCNIPLANTTQTTACALGGNPKFPGNEFLSARFSDFRFHARAFTDEEIRANTNQR